MLEEYHKRQPNAYACLGLTFYKEHKIWIAEELCDDEKIRTLNGINTGSIIKINTDSFNIPVNLYSIFDKYDVNQVMLQVEGKNVKSIGRNDLK